jgi:hypothetical protein
MSKREPWRNRIIGHGEQPAISFMANPLNWRIHPKAQRDALTGILGDVGWVQSVIVNKTTGNVVDGHARIEEALKLGDDTPVPFVEVELSEEEEQKILLTLDPISALAAADKENLQALMDSASFDSPALDQMLADLAAEVGLVMDGAAEKQGDIDAEKPIVQLDIASPDLTFPSDNKYGIPTLKTQGDLAGMPRPCERWGMKARGSRNEGSLHFYTDDARFETVWQKPEWIVQSGAIAIVEPNITTHPAMPLAFVLWGIYRKRWLSRWAQQYNVFIFVDLNVEPMFHEINLLGVPAGWKHYATRGYDSKPEMLEADYQCAVKHAGTEEIVFAVFGGGNATRNTCIARNWIHIPQESHVIEGRYEQREVSDG